MSGEKQAPNDHEMPYLVAFPVEETWELPETFKVGMIPELIECRVQRAEDVPGRLVTYWKRPEAYNVHAEVLRTKLALPDPDFQAFETKTGPPPPPWFRRYWAHTAAALSTLVLLGTQFETLRTLGPKAWAVPRVTIVGPSQVLKVAVGVATDVPLTVQNASSSEVEARLEAFSITPAAGLTTSATQRPLQLPKGETKPFSIPLLAEKPGNYVLQPAGSMRAGWLHGRRPIPGVAAIQIEAWVKIDEQPKVELENSSEYGAFYFVRVRHGQPPKDESINYQLSAPGGGDISFTTVKPGDIVKKAAATNTAAVVWKARGTPFAEQVFSVEVSASTPKTDAFWQELTNRMRAYVE